MKIYSFVTLLISSLFIITGCNNEDAFSNPNNSASEITAPPPVVRPPATANLHSLTIVPHDYSTVVTSPQEMFVNSSLRLKVIGAFDNGLDYDLTNKVTISSSNNTVASVTGNLVQGLASGSVQLFADSIEHTGIRSPAYDLNVLGSSDAGTINAGVCGSQINDNNLTNAKDGCMKLISDDRGNWFTSNPSIVFINAQAGFTPVHSSDPAVPRPYKTYSGEDSEIGYTPAGLTNFARFFQGYPDNFDGGQYELWCNYLNEIEFAGKKNWDRVTAPELANLVSYRGALRANYGWPAENHYHTKTVAPITGAIAVKVNGVLNEKVITTGRPYYASCTSRGNN